MADSVGGEKLAVTVVFVRENFTVLVRDLVGPMDLDFDVVADRVWEAVPTFEADAVGDLEKDRSLDIEKLAVLSAVGGGVFVVSLSDNDRVGCRVGVFRDAEIVHDFVRSLLHEWCVTDTDGDREGV